MKISQLLKEDLIFLDIPAADKFAAIDFLADKMKDAEGVEDIDLLRQDIVIRENQIPTGLENGCAIPHARSEGVTCLVLSFARLNESADFGAIDGIPARLIFQFGIPPESIAEYLKILAKLSRLLKKSDIRETLLHAQSASDIIQAFAEK